MPLTTHGLTPGLDRALEESLVDDMRARGQEIGVIAAGPLVRLRFEDLTADDWRMHLNRVYQAISAAERVALAAKATHKYATIVFLAHPSSALYGQGSMLNTVGESVLQGFVSSGGIRSVNTQAICNIASLRYTGWGFSQSDLDSVDDSEIVELIHFLLSPAARHIDKAMISLDRRGHVVSSIGSSSPLLGLGND